MPPIIAIDGPAASGKGTSTIMPRIAGITLGAKTGGCASAA